MAQEGEAQAACTCVSQHSCDCVAHTSIQLQGDDHSMHIIHPLNANL
jgi:hypothetical protein